MNRKLQSLNKVIDALEKLQKNSLVSNSEVFSNDFKRIINRLKDNSFKIAVVGEFSSGKSTFLNALIGQDLLKHGAQETTATITEIYNDPNCFKSPMLDIYYANGKVVKNITSDEINEFTATSSKKYLVSKEIEKVVIRSRILTQHSNICLIDTPGLNGIADNHREKTIEQIKDAHACIYLMQVRGLGQSDIEFLKYICKYQHNIIFVQNFIDELKELEGETVEEKITEQKRIIEEKIKEEVKDLSYQIVGISARKALISKVETFESYHGELLNKEMRKKLYNESKFEKIIEVLNSFIENNEKNMQKYYDTVVVAKNFLIELKKLVDFQNETKEKEWLKSSLGVDYQNANRLIEILEKNRSNYQEKLNNYIESETYNIKKENSKDIENGIEEIYRELENNILNIKEIENFKNYIENRVNSDLYMKSSNLENGLNKRVNIKFENLLYNAILRIESYTGAEVNSDKSSYNFSLENKIKDIKIKNFEEEEQKIKKLEKDIFSKKELEEKYQKDIRIKLNEQNNLKFQLQENNSKLNQIKNLKRGEITRLGEMPEPERKYRTETYEEYRGGTGFLDWVLGPKIKTKKIPYNDYTNQEIWRSKRNEIEHKYDEQEIRLNQQIRSINLQKQSCEEEIESIKNSEKIRLEEIKGLERILQRKLEYIKVQKEKAKQEYLRETKRSMLDSIKNYLYENIKELFIDNFDEIIIENKNRVREIIISLFELSYNERIKSLKIIVNNIQNNKTLENNKSLYKIIDDIIIKMEEFLCQ